MYLEYKILLCIFLDIVLYTKSELLFNTSDYINSTNGYFINYTNINPEIPIQVTVSSSNSSREFPILVVVRQQRQILSWQIPLLVDTEHGELEFSNTSRILCPDHMKSNIFLQTIVAETLTISLTTSSLSNISFSLKLNKQDDFNVLLGEEYTAVISPSNPKIYYYQFPENSTENDTETVLLKISSNSNVCMYASVQSNSCPIYDLEHDIRFQGFWETVSYQGGLTIPKSKFPSGFFLVFVSKGDDSACSGVSSHSQVINRNKQLKFSLLPGITRHDYISSIIVTLIVVVTFYFLVWVFIFIISLQKKRLPLRMDAVDVIDDSAVLTPGSTISRGFAEEFNDDIIDDHSSLDETEYDTITEATERGIYRTKSILFVCDLARKPPRLLQKKSYLYLWHVITVAVFYGLPVVQLVVTYQRVLFDTGNQDLCYYNFLCSHPLGLLSDFNHVFSNVGYVVLGILFISLVHRRESWHNEDPNFERQYGIPQHHGLFYAMGFALIMEGILSASYHVCPNHTNFQFDSSFMYVMAVLIMVKLYQNRHPDINATAYATFGVLAAAIFIGMIGILEPSIYFWGMFTVLHLSICFLLSIQIYYMGCWKFDKGIILRVYRVLHNDFNAGFVHLLKPIYKSRMCLLILANIWNWTLAVLGLLHHERDFATYLLAIFMSNTLLYTIFYIVMKIIHKERIMAHAIFFIFLATATWIAATYFFLRKNISWVLTPAQSRVYNKNCELMKFYDAHDIWHFLSACAMFFCFMILLTLDDDLMHTHRSKIPVF